MARRVKAQLDEFKVDSALEEMIDTQFDETLVINDLNDIDDSIIDVDQLAQQIALATAENSNEDKKFSEPTVDDSVGEHLFNKTSTDTIIPAGTVKDDVVTKPVKAANDDRGTLWMNRSNKALSFKRLYMGTTALSALWAVGGLTFAHKLSAGGIFSFSSLGSFFSSPMGLAVSAGTVLPIAMFWGFAQLTKRSKELQSAIYSISDAATRIVAPNTSSPDIQLNQIGSNVRQELSLMNQGIEKTISRAVELEALIQGEVKNLERAYSENENRIHNLIKELSSEREAILGHADQVKAIIRNSQDQLAGEFSSITANIAVGVEDISNTLSNTVKENGEKLIKSLHNASDEISQKISERVDDNTKNLSTNIGHTTEKALADFETKLNLFDKKMLDRTNSSITNFDDSVLKLSDKFNTVSSVFNSATEQAIHAFEERLSNIDSLLNERSSSIIHAFIARAETLDQNADKLGDILEERITRINQTLKDRTDDISNAIESGHVHMDSALKQRISDITTVFDGNNQEIHTSFSKYIEDMSKVVANNYNNLNTILQKRLAEITSAYETGNTHASSTLNAYTDKVSQSLTAGYEQFSTYLQQSANDVLKALDSKSELTSESLKARTVEIEKAFENGWRHIDETLNKRIQDIANNINGSQNSLDSTVKANLSQIIDVFNQNREEISNSIRERLFEISSIFEGERSNIDSLVQVVATRLTNEADKIDQTISNVMNNRTDDIIHQLDNGRVNFEKSIRNSSDEIIGSINEQLGTLTHQVTDIEKTIADNIQLVNSHINEHSQHINVSTQSLVQTIENNKGYLNTLSDQTNIIKSLVEKSSGFYTSLDNVTNRLQQTFNNHSALFEEQSVNFNKTIENNLSIVNQDFNLRVAQMGASFNEMLQQAVISADGVGEKLNQTVLSFETGLEQARYTLYQESDRVAESFQDKLNNITQNVSEKITQSSEIISSIGQEASKNIEVATTSIGERISNITNAQIESFSEQIEKMNKASETLFTAADQTSHTFGTLSSEFAKKLNEASIIAREDIRRGNEEIVTAFSTRATETITSIQTANNEMHQNMNVVLSNVDTAVNKLNQSLGTIKNTSNEFINHVNSADGKFTESTQLFADNIRAARETLDQSSVALTSNIDQMKAVSSQAFEQLKNIGTDFSQHSALLEKAASLLQNSQNEFVKNLENQHNQINNVTSGLAKKSDEIAQSIKNYSLLLFNKMKETQDFSKKSAIDMQNELVTLVGKAVSKFSNATEEIRKTAHAVDNEINTITSNIHQSVNSLPVKAKQSTEAMRIAISEQVSALKELSYLMTQSASVAEITNATEATNITEPQQEQFVAHEVEEETKIESKPQKAVRETKQPILTPSSRDNVLSSFNEKTQGSWVSELLARASRGDEEDENEETEVQVLDDMRAIAQNIETRKDLSQDRIESLNSMSHEIVRAFDHNAIVELWADYRRNRNNINVQKLYTNNGQITFKRVSNKYNKDADFRQSVNQYISDFEQVLREVQKTHGKSEVRSYLVSDPGKVYTMLAQVSGRIQ